MLALWLAYFGNEMTKDEIKKMAYEAYTSAAIAEFTPMTDEALERFAALVADAEAKRIHEEGMVTVGHMREQMAAEREACANLVFHSPPSDEYESPLTAVYNAIRARGNK